jgi:SNF2 family DNA or RNA helicase
MSEVFAELNERGDRCILNFRYDEGTKNKIKYNVPGARFVPRDKGGPYWQLPLDLASMRILREQFGKKLILGDALKAWGREAVGQERKMRSLAVADDYPPEEMKLYRKLPKMLLGDKKIGWPGLRPYQRADIMFLSAQKGAMNLNEQRLGKTPEIIGSIFEADAENEPILIVGLQKSLDSVWRYEFERFTHLPVFTFNGNTSSTLRAKALAAVEDLLDDGLPFVFATTADMIRRGLPDGLELAIEWGTMVIDEFHKTGLAEPKNVFPKKAINIRAKRKYAMSGTPMGGKPIKLWGALHYLHPDSFTSKWRWAEQWLDVTKGYDNHRNIGGIKHGKEDDFYAALAPYAVRRLRTEVLPQLPPKQHVNVWCGMSKKQRAQYDVFAADAEIRIDEYHLSATSVLAEYTRLKQFANARCEVEILSRDFDTGEVEMKVVPTFDSGKLPELLERLIEQGIDPDDPAGTSQAIVCSQFREHIEMVSRWLTEQGIKNALFTGKTNKRESERIQKAFKAGNDNEGLRVCCMVTTMGVGITLDNVETVHVVDETWNPDDGEQVTDRAINTTRNHQVSVFWYRSKNSIEEYIYGVTSEKAEVNKEILDLRRQGFRATGGVK